MRTLDEFDIAAGLLLAVELKGERYWQRRNWATNDGEPVCLVATAYACLGLEVQYRNVPMPGLAFRPSLTRSAWDLANRAMHASDRPVSWGKAVTEALA